MQIFRNAYVVVGTAIAYYLFCQLNAALFSSFNYSYGVTWIFLPSGLRLAFVAILGVWGAAGIALASTATSILSNAEGDLISFLGTGAISGLSPLLALWISRRYFGLDRLLNNLSAITLIKMSALFSVVNALMHQYWYFLRGHTTHPFDSAVVMLVGDLFGTLLMFYIVKIILSNLPVPRT